MPQAAPLFWLLSPIFLLMVTLIFILNHFSLPTIFILDNNPKVPSPNWSW